MNPPVEPDSKHEPPRNLTSTEHNVFILETSAQKGKGSAGDLTYRYAKASVDRQPKPPNDVHVVTQPGKALLSWSPVADARGYFVYRALPDKPWQADWKLIAKVDGATFEDSQLEAGKAFVYTVCSVGPDGQESRRSFRARTQPGVLPQPVVSVLAADKVELVWKPHTAKDVRGYNVYRGNVAVRTVRKGTQAPWKDNDPEYAEPVPVEVRDITEIRKLTIRRCRALRFSTARLIWPVDAGADEYRFNVYAYIVKAVNELGTESGPSPMR